MITFKKRWTSIQWLFLLTVSLLMPLLSCQATKSPFVIQRLGNEHTMVRLTEAKKYLLLPIQEKAPEARLNFIVNNQLENYMNVRLAREEVDYYVPVDISTFDIQTFALNFQMIPDGSLCWSEMSLSDTFDTSNREKYRPTYHFAPQYGWMNDPNGMVYKDGVYHLFYQYNPYGSMWGNMHWGHATTTDLVNWQHQPVAIAPDVLGTIFSGSAVVDAHNTAGFGKDAIVAFYTSAGERQTQSVAYSLDNGKSFTKYAGNPVLTSPAPDFRDPKVFWHNQSKQWIMIIAVGQEMQLFSSANLTEWAYESSFGEGEGAHGGVWECPDLIEVAVEGTNQKKWVLICNINPGGPFGGSATQYFVGTFDGKKFVNESPKLTKWMDYGKDHYATVTWSNAPDGRHIGIAWMSNWQYANEVPTLQFRSANSVPRDFTLFVSDGETYLKSAPSKELLALRSGSSTTEPFEVNKSYNMDKLATGGTNAFEIEMTIHNNDAEVIGFQLFNGKGEMVDIFYNLVEKTFSMDRNQSGLVAFSKEFPAVTVAPVYGTKEMNLRFFVDNSSIEAFGNDGEFAMTNLVFPTDAYDRISFYAKGGSYRVTKFACYRLEAKN